MPLRAMPDASIHDDRHAAKDAEYARPPPLPRFSESARTAAGRLPAAFIVSGRKGRIAAPKRQVEAPSSLIAGDGRSMR